MPEPSAEATSTTTFMRVGRQAKDTMSSGDIVTTQVSSERASAAQAQPHSTSSISAAGRNTTQPRPAAPDSFAAAYPATIRNLASPKFPKVRVSGPTADPLSVVEQFSQAHSPICG